MRVFNLIFKNMFRHTLRSALTVFGIAIAVMAFGLLRTVIGSWYAGLDATSPNRLVTRHAVSFIFPLPYAYRDLISSVPGVTGVSYATWFQGKYIDDRNFFPRTAIDAETMFSLYPEYILSDDQLQSFKNTRNGCIIGVKTAAKFNLKIGDIMPVEGDIYPGRYEFVITGIYRGAQPSVDETQMFFHWQYLEEALKRDMPERSGQVGWYIIRIADPSASAAVSDAIDALFQNSPAETKTETEKAFTQGFISMSSTIISAMQFISYIIIGIILLVLANTMAMTARERIVEYAVLKTLGFRGYHLIGLIAGESILISMLGSVIGLGLTFPVTQGVAEQLSNFFPVFRINLLTLVSAVSFALLVGVLSSVVPIHKAMTTTIVEGLRHIG